MHKSKKYQQYAHYYSCPSCSVRWTELSDYPQTKWTIFCSTCDYKLRKETDLFTWWEDED